MLESGNEQKGEGEFFLGIDVGSTSLKGAIYRVGEGVVECRFMVPTQGRPLESLRELVRQVTTSVRNVDLQVGATGVGKNQLRVSNLPVENEIIATAQGAAILCPQAMDLVEIGGQFTKWIHLDKTHAVTTTVADYSTNDLCAAGSGSFLEQQASRLHISVEALGDLAAHASHGATIAGRCSVFAKSDMIHLQQKGVPLDELAYGLCLAVARNFLGTILRGRTLTTPAAFIGGGATNRGLVRAFREVLDLSDEDFFVPEGYRHFGAVGACLAAQASQTGPTLRELERALVDGTAPMEIHIPRHGSPLKKSEGALPQEEPVGRGTGLVEAFLGVDVGSVSTDFAVMASDGEIIDSVYLATRGRPIEVLTEGLDQIHGRYGDRLRILGVGATGSGRYLASAFLGADVVKNEITAQLASAAAFFPDVDTIFEIGGQDSKYIRAAGGQVRDFTMNKICAAGTGSFLEEQAERLGIRIIGDFAELALAGSAPVDLGNRCTVFIDSELSFVQQQGIPLEEITAGLAYAIARNYLEKVVAGRPVGRQVVFQGGVASNRAVVAAFESLLGRSIQVHPYNRISGAIGAALLAGTAARLGQSKSRFRGFEMLRNYEVNTFECKHCSNRCQVSRFEIGGQPVFFGDTCERYSGTKEKAGNVQFPDLFEEREKIISRCLSEEPREQTRGVIGIPRATLFCELIPLWADFFHRLGYRVELSSPSSSELFAKGLRALPIETCLPIKLTFGHVLDLQDKGVDHIFLPSIHRLPTPWNNDDKAATCVYSEHVSYMVQAAAPSKVIAPKIGLAGDAKALSRAASGIAKTLGSERGEVKEAFGHAFTAYEAFVHELEERGKEVLSGSFNRAFVILGRPYNLYDSFQNLNLARHLRHLGILAIPMNFLPLSTVSLTDEWDQLLWKFNRDCIRAAEITRRDDRLFPVILSSFGCGPEGFAVRHLERLFEDRPHLFLEFDEHRGEAGLITRLEAFIDEVETHQRLRSNRETETITGGPERSGSAARGFFPVPPLTSGATVFVPHFADHAHAFAGAFRALGHQSEVLPPPDTEAAKAGQQFSTGRECQPFVLMAGDLVSLVRSGKSKSGDAFFFPGTNDVPCLLSQFGHGYRHILDALGAHDIEIIAPPLSDVSKLFGATIAITLWQGLVAMDLLTRMVCERRPYECERGAVNQVHGINLKEIEDSIANNQLTACIRRCVARLDAVPIRRESPRPLVGVAGDVYTRINEFSNDNLFSRLEDMGCEVWPSPFLVENVDFGLRQDLGQSVMEKNFGNALGQSKMFLLKESTRWKVRRAFDGLLRHHEEPGFTEVLRLAAPYAHAGANPVLLLNIAKIVDFTKKGAAGVINAMGFNCMIGTVSAALLQRIRADHGDIPIVNLVYGETESVGQRSRLEAFVHQVKAYAHHHPSRAETVAK